MTEWITMGADYGPRKQLLPLGGAFIVGDLIRVKETGENMLVLEDRGRYLLVRRAIGAASAQTISFGYSIMRIGRIEDAIRV